MATPYTAQTFGEVRMGDNDNAIQGTVHNKPKNMSSMIQVSRHW